ncbi:MAG: RNA polymerase sporulation sigma factor SigE [Clostridia bacterium]|nr:RNA polymerase sporulation sigma factor SigE [Clostridia bacterium]MBP3554214.1 RNA polymerase sporulation sigma factor SigE [Clostridia bacterium]MBQ8419572.1 RNA polymerase sporulation sigma factor SigE [Clostridia bacterium]
MKWFLKFRLWLVRLFLSMRGERGVYYIGKTDTLPPPLSAEEEAELLANLDGDKRFRGILVERNLRLVVYIAKKFENTGIGMDDLISIGTIGLMKAANTFRPDKNIKLATYASRCIENEILMFIRKSSNLRVELSIDEPLSTDYDGNELVLSDILGTDEDSAMQGIEADEEKKIIYDAVATLAPREREIIEMRFGLHGGREMTQKEVADALGISQSYISRLEKRILAHLKEEIQDKL